MVCGDLLLIRNRVTLRFRLSRATPTQQNANPVRLHLFRPTPSAKKKITRFRRRVKWKLVGHGLFFLLKPQASPPPPSNTYKMSRCGRRQPLGAGRAGVKCHPYPRCPSLTPCPAKPLYFHCGHFARNLPESLRCLITGRSMRNSFFLSVNAKKFPGASRLPGSRVPPRAYGAMRFPPSRRKLPAGRYSRSPSAPRFVGRGPAASSSARRHNNWARLLRR